MDFAEYSGSVCKVRLCGDLIQIPFLRCFGLFMRKWFVFSCSLQT